MARFQVLGCIGMGGMGQVYAAYDPQLDRKVALKVLHEERDRRDDPRLIREAQGLARLTHPNVVTVHEVGSHRGRLFVAMEFVEGVTLRDWLRSHPPGPAERLATVLDYMIQAGEGLAAAHRAGLIHRDFKPGNVLLGEDGRVRVVDFGLVRVEPGSSAGRKYLKSVRDASLLDEKLVALLDDRPLTRTGSLLGTPAYMAPEQFLMTKVDTSTDQFAFCLTAWEAIFGTRPFPGKAIPAVLEAIRGRRPARPTRVECPAAIEMALRKGLAFGPGRRHVSMEALLEVLKDARVRLNEGAPPRAPGQRRVGVSAVALIGVMGSAALALGLGDSQVCSGGVEHMAGIWDEAVKTKLKPAFLGAQVSFAPEAWDRFERGLDEYARVWVVGHREACEATQVRKEQSAEQMDLRMACLYSRQQYLAALTEVYARPDADMLARADEAVAALASVNACADPEYVHHRGVIPANPEQATRVEDIHQTIALSVAHEVAGHYAQALDLAEEAVIAADELTLLMPRARASHQRGVIHTRLRQGERARDDLENAYLLAAQAELREIAFESSRVLVQVEGVLLHRFSAARWWARVARFQSEHVDDARLLAKLHVDLGAMHQIEGHSDEAAKSYKTAIDLLGRNAGPESPAHAAALQALGELKLVQGGPNEALPLLEEALVMVEEALGTQHPSVARFHTSVSRAHRLGGDLDRAMEHIERAVELSENTFGRDHVALHSALEELSRVLEDRGDFERAIAQIERARMLDVPGPIDVVARARLFAREGEIRFQQHEFKNAEEVYRHAVELASAEFGDAHPDTARYRIGLGAALGGLGHRREATALIQAGLAVREAVLGGEHPNVASTYDTLAAEMERVGDLDRALEYTQRSLEIVTAAYGDASFPSIVPHSNMCAVLGHLGHVQQAVSHCHQALDIARSAVSYDQRLIAGLHNNLGAALANSGRHEDAISHYDRARMIWEHLHGSQDISVAIVVANLAETKQAVGQLEEAYEQYLQSLTIREQLLGREHPMVMVPLVGMANALILRHRAYEAIPLARRAIEVSEDGRASPLARARAQEALAQALWANPGTRSEANALATKAMETFEQTGRPAKADRERLARWWAALRGG